VRRKATEAIGAEKLEKVKDEFEAFVERTAKKALELPEESREAFVEENIEKFKKFIRVVTTIGRSSRSAEFRSTALKTRIRKTR